MENKIIPIEEEKKENIILPKQEVKQEPKQELSISLEDGKFKFGGFNDVLQFSKVISASNLVPSSFQGKPADIAVCIGMGLEKGLTPFQSLSSICVINGRPSIWGDALIGLAQKTGELESIKCEFSGKRKENDWVCTCKVKRKGVAEISCSFSWEEAKEAGLLTKKMSVWLSYPNRMMESRAKSYALRTAFADVFCGLYTAEEMQDISDDPKDVTPKTAGLESVNQGEIVDDV